MSRAVEDQERERERERDGIWQSDGGDDTGEGRFSAEGAKKVNGEEDGEEDGEGERERGGGDGMDLMKTPLSFRKRAVILGLSRRPWSMRGRARDEVKGACNGGQMGFARRRKKVGHKGKMRPKGKASTVLLGSSSALALTRPNAFRGSLEKRDGHVMYTCKTKEGEAFCWHALLYGVRSNYRGLYNYKTSLLQMYTMF